MAGRGHLCVESPACDVMGRSIRDFLFTAEVGSGFSGGWIEFIPVFVWREDGGQEAFWKLRTFPEAPERGPTCRR